MVKRVSLLRRKDGMTHQQFIDHWRGPHLEIVRAMPGLRGYRLLEVVDPTAEPLWDGIGELWFDSQQSCEAAFASQPARSLLAADRPLFVAEMQVLYTMDLEQASIGG